jgi:hypothetical protein
MFLPVMYHHWPSAEGTERVTAMACPLDRPPPSTFLSKGHPTWALTSSPGFTVFPSHA